MPLLWYFTLVGPALLGLLFVAEAQLGPPQSSLSISTAHYGLPPPFKAKDSNAKKDVAILTVRDAPAPPKGTTAQAAHAAASPAVETAAKTNGKVASAAKTKKTRVVRREVPPHNMFAYQPQNMYAQQNMFMQSPQNAFARPPQNMYAYPRQNMFAQSPRGGIFW